MNRMVRRFALLLSVLIAVSLCACSSEAPSAMTYDKTVITEGMYSYWLSAYKTNFVYNYGGGEETEEFWNQTLEDGMTYAEYAERVIIRTVKYFTVGIELFRQYGLTIDKDISESVDADIQEKLEYAGSRSALNSDLAKFGINIDGLKSVYIAEEKWQAIYEYLYGDNGIEKVSDSDIDEYYRENYSLVKLIPFYTEYKAKKDENGDNVFDSEGLIVKENLTDAEKQQKEQDIQYVLSALKNGESFDSLAAEYSDEDLSYYESGCFINGDSAAQYGPALTEKAPEMEIGEIARIDDEGITFIAIKQELPSLSDLIDCEKEQLSDLEDKVIQLAYMEKFSALAEQVKVNDEIISAHPIKEAPLNLYY